MSEIIFKVGDNEYTLEQLLNKCDLKESSKKITEKLDGSKWKIDELKEEKEDLTKELKGVRSKMYQNKENNLIINKAVKAIEQNINIIKQLTGG